MDIKVHEWIECLPAACVLKDTLYVVHSKRIEIRKPNIFSNLPELRMAQLYECRLSPTWFGLQRRRHTPPAHNVVFHNTARAGALVELLSAIHLVSDEQPHSSRR